MSFVGSVHNYVVFYRIGMDRYRIHTVIFDVLKKKKCFKLNRCKFGYFGVYCKFNRCTGFVFF